MSDKLRECPFCGKLPELNMFKIVGKSGDSIKYTYECSNCGLLMIEWDKERLIKTWNTRHEPKHETVEQWEERTGETYSDDGPVWYENRWEDWSLDTWGEMAGIIDCIVANHHGKPEVSNG